MAGHRYWRLRVRETDGGTAPGLGELEMRTSLGGSNVCVGGTPIASSQYSTNHAPKNAFDGNTESAAWSSSSMNTSTRLDGSGERPWIGYDFGEGVEQDIAEIAIYAPSSGLYIRDMVTAWDFQWSDDGESWVTQRSYPNEIETPAWSASTVRIYDVRPLGAINIRNRAVMLIAKYRQQAPGLPGNPIPLDPGSPEGRILQSQTQYSWDGNQGGLYKLAGSTTSLGFPAPRRVRLYSQVSGRLYAEKITSTDGLFEFTNIDIGPWVVIGLDDTGAQNGVIYSHILAVPM